MNTNKTHTQSHDEFVAMLNKVLAEIKKKAENQYAYNLNTNIPNKIAGITLENAAEHAINNGLVSAISEFHGWGTHESLLFAYHILEDVNAHAEARELVKFIPEYQ